MNEFLLVSLGPRPEAPVEWLLWSRDEARCVDAGQLAHADELPQLAQLARSHPCYALLPQEQVLVTEVRLPNASRAARRAIPYQLEEQLCDDPTLLHFAVGSSRADHRYPVAIVARPLIESWRDRLRAASIPARALFADAQSLCCDSERLIATPLGERLLINGAGLAGLAFASAELASWRPLLERHGALEVLPAALDDPPLAALAARLAPGQAIDLLQGEYRLQDAPGTRLRSLRIPAALGLLTLILGFAALGLENHRLARQKEALDQQVAELFRGAFPEVQRVVDPRAQLEQKLDELRQRRQGSRFLRLLEKSVPAFRQHGAVKVTGMRYAKDERRLELELQAAEQSAFERFAAALEQNGLRARLGQVQKRQQDSTVQMAVEGIN